MYTLLSLDLTTGHSNAGCAMWCLNSPIMSYRSSFNVISCKVFIGIDVIGDAKNGMKVLYYIFSFPSDTKNAHINIYKDYQNRNIKLETIFYRDLWI